MNKLEIGVGVVVCALALGACAPAATSPATPAATPAASPGGTPAASPAATPAATPAAASPMVGGWSVVPTDDARLRTAIDRGVALLRGPEWLATPELAAEALTAGERQVVAGTNHRAMFPITVGGKRRQARLVVFEDLAGAFHVTSVDLGPVGSESPLLDVPPDTGAPGGWTAQSVGDPAIVRVGDKVRALLAEADWLGRAVVVDRIAAVKTQVVAGLNTYLALDAQVGGYSRRVDVIVYEPLQGAASLSWIRVSEAAPAR